MTALASSPDGFWPASNKVEAPPGTGLHCSHIVLGPELPSIRVKCLWARNNSVVYVYFRIV